MKQRATTDLDLLEKTKKQTWRNRALLLATVAFIGSGLSGCVATAGTGYGAAYYAPDYGAYYGDYGYNGYPYWGGGPYIGSTLVIAGRSHRGYYGGHHFSHHRHGGHSHGSFHGGGGFHGHSGGGHRRGDR